jgi:hypothetical protein
LSINFFLDLLERVIRSCCGLDRENRAQSIGTVVRDNILRNPLLIDETLIEPADFVATKNVRGYVGDAILVCVDRRTNPCHVKTRQLDTVLDDKPAFFRDRRRLHGDRRNIRPPLQTSEILFNKSQGCCLVDVANDGKARVVGNVVLLEKALHIFQLRCLNVGMRANDRGVVRMVFGIHQVRQRLFDRAVGPILEVLTPFVADDVLLIPEGGFCEIIQQIAHPVGLQP